MRRNIYKYTEYTFLELWIKQRLLEYVIQENTNNKILFYKNAYKKSQVIVFYFIILNTLYPYKRYFSLKNDPSSPLKTGIK